MSSRGLAVRTRSLVHVYQSSSDNKVAALTGVDLTIEAGEMIGLLGPSGAGKSTLLALLGGLFRPSAGRVVIGDVEVSASSQRDLDLMHARDVALMLQGAGRNLLPYLTPAQNVGFAQAVARRVDRRTDAADLPDAEWLLETVGLGDRADAPLSSLTPGHLQLVAIAVALANRPGLLLADEPTSQLDHAARAEVLACIARINHELGTTVVLVTHDPEVARWMPRTVTIRDGRIGGEGRSGEEYAVVTADGFLPLPAHVAEALPAGTLVRFYSAADGFQLRVEEES